VYICICFGVAENEIESEIATGASTVDEVGERCGAGTACGSCAEKISLLLRRCGKRHGKISAEAIA
jgi:bacterioferritin-associated ferredoxin